VQVLGENLATQEKISRELVESLRESLILEVLSGGPKAPITKKAAVRELMVPLIAGRRNGMSFEELAEMCARGGLPISSDTLRSYFFELKTNADVAAAARIRAPRVDAVGKMAAATRRAERQTVALTERGAGEHVPKQDHVATPSHVAVQKPEPASTATVTPAVAPELAPRIAAVPAATLVSAVAPTPVMESPPASTGQAYTIAELEECSQAPGAGTPLPLTEDLVVREGYVYCASGQAFRGLLTAKQSRLLAQSGRIYAPRVGRSSGDFVKMREKL